MRLRRIQPFFACASAVTTLLAGSSASAAILAVDFNDGGSAAPNFTQGGFIGLAVGQTASSYNSGSLAGPYTVSLSGLSGARLRAQPTPGTPVAPLYADFVFRSDNNVDTADSFTLTVEGLEASTTYDVTFYAFDGNNFTDRSQTYAPVGDTQGQTAVATFGSINNSGAIPDELSDYAVTVRLTTNANGSFSYSVTGTTGNGQFPALNGFEVNAVPEPASMALLASGAAMMFVRRRG